MAIDGGALRIAVTMTGLDVDPDGVHVQVTRLQPIVVGHSSATHVHLPAGKHAGTLDGLVAPRAGGNAPPKRPTGRSPE